MELCVRENRKENLDMPQEITDTILLLSWGQVDSTYH